MAADLGAVTRILASIESPRGLRSQSRKGDLQGAFDQWFDGGAVKHVTGWNEYHFADGTVAVVHGTLTLRIDIRVPAGQYVSIGELSSGRPPFPFGAA